MTQQALGPFVIFFASIFTSNIVLANYLGMCPFIAVSRQMKSFANRGWINLSRGHVELLDRPALDALARAD